jgi:quinol monooxygenase YgiN
LQFDVIRANNDSCHIMLYEVYANEDAFKTHMTMAHTQAFLGPAKDMVTKPPAATFLTRITAASKSGK